jgi:hypothetical protein
VLPGSLALAVEDGGGYCKFVLSALAPLLGGIVGTAAMSPLLLLPRGLGIGKIDVIPAVGALITGKFENAFSIGYIVHFASGIAFAYVYLGYCS